MFGHVLQNSPFVLRLVLEYHQMLWVKPLQRDRCLLLLRWCGEVLRMRELADGEQLLQGLISPFHRLTEQSERELVRVRELKDLGDFFGLLFGLLGAGLREARCYCLPYFLSVVAQQAEQRLVGYSASRNCRAVLLVEVQDDPEYLQEVLLLYGTAVVIPTLHDEVVQLAAQELREKYPERQLVVIDSLCASMGEGLLVHHALQNRAAGMSLEDNAAWVRDNVPHLAHWFTVDDLMFLLRGGRVSAASAYLGTMMRIKPILNVDEEGHLIPREKVQGRKRSIHHLLDKMKEHVVDPENQVIFISHGDCADEANHLAELVRETFHPKEILVGYIGPVIGAHTGPGTVALFFFGTPRQG